MHYRFLDRNGRQHYDQHLTDRFWREAKREGSALIWSPEVRLYDYSELTYTDWRIESEPDIWIYKVEVLVPPSDVATLGQPKVGAPPPRAAEDEPLANSAIPESADLGSVAKSTAIERPAEPTSTTDPRRSRHRRKGEGTQTRTARTVLLRIFTDGNYPSEEELSTPDLRELFRLAYESVEGKKPKGPTPSRYAIPSMSTMLRVVGRKD